MKTLLLFSFLFLSAVTNLYSQPSTLSLQGVLRDQSGAAVADGNYTLVFNIYSAATGGSSIWSETQNNVALVNGVFSVRLGSVTSFGSLNFTQQYWVGIRVGSTGATELSPRIELTAVPYAFALKGGENILAGSGSIGIGTLSPSQKLHVNGNVRVDGNLGVGTNSTANKLEVSGNTNMSGNLSVSGSVSAGSISAGSISGTNNNVTVNGNLSMSGVLNGKPSIFGKREGPNYKPLQFTINVTNAYWFVAEADMLVTVMITSSTADGITWIRAKCNDLIVHQYAYNVKEFTLTFPVKKGETVDISYWNTRNSESEMHRLHLGNL